MGTKRTPLTKEQFEILRTQPGWNIDEVPRDHWPKIPVLQRLNETVSVMASGSCNDPQMLNGVLSVAGLDVLGAEPNSQESDPRGNAYHYVLQQLDHGDYLYLMHGPFRMGPIVSHWFEADDLAKYWADLP